MNRILLKLPKVTKLSVLVRRFGSIPTIKLSENEAEKLNSACRDIGFVYVQDEESSNLISQCLEQAQWFFSLPEFIKQGCSGMAGYTSRRGYYIYEAQSGPNDKIECFSVGREISDPASLRQPYYEKIGMPKDMWYAQASQTNQWPQPHKFHLSDPLIQDFPLQSDRFQQTMLQYFDRCTSNCLSIMRLMATSMGLPETYFDDAHDKMDHTLELKLYPPISSNHHQNANPNHNSTPHSGAHVLSPQMAWDGRPELEQTSFEDTDVRLAQHADLSSVTLLIQDSVGGLEVLDSTTSEWIAAPATKNSFLCNTGDFMADWTSGYFKSTQHRVSYPANNRSRISVVFFCTPNFDCKMRHTEITDPEQLDYCGDRMPFL